MPETILKPILHLRWEEGGQIVAMSDQLYAIELLMILISILFIEIIWKLYYSQKSISLLIVFFNYNELI